MNSFKKVLVWLGLVIMLCLSFSKLAVEASEHSNESYSKASFQHMTAYESLECLIKNGLILPSDYSIHHDLAEGFIFHYLPLVLNKAIGTEDILFNNSQSNALLKNIGLTLDQMGVPHLKNMRDLRYSLVDSTGIGSWNSSYGWYNCYSYAIGYYNSIFFYPTFLHPGDIYAYYNGSTNPYSLTMTINQLANLVLQDLGTLNYWGYTSTTKPTSLPDQYFRVIALRKDTNNSDFHFMKMNGSLNTWVHKPGASLPLRWNYSSPNYKIWTNESINQYGYGVAPDTTYESGIIYILYKSFDDPGIQYQDVYPIHLYK